jgi:YVTN family beta-propeller protein
VVDTATNRVIATITVGSSPEGVAVRPAGGTVYVANKRSNNVSVIDTATNAVTGPIPVGSEPGGVAVTPDGSKLYVANFLSNNVSVIDAETNRVTAAIPLGASYPWYVLLEMSSSESGIRELLERLLGLALEAGWVGDGVIAASGAQAKELWRFREAIVEAQNYSGSIKHDVSVPVSRVAEFINRASQLVTERLPGIRPMAFGHVGDGNIHFNLTQPEGADREAYLARWQEFNDIVHGVVRDLAGSISAEHGVGLLKCEEITRYKPLSRSS